MSNTERQEAFETNKGFTYINRQGSAAMRPDANDASPVNDIFEGIDLDGEIKTLLEMLGRDDSPEVRAALQTAEAAKARSFAGQWFQRIDFPRHGFASTSERSNAWVDEGGVNTLGRRLTAEQASVLRPYPKWVYLKQRMPDVRGKTVLEVGSSNGFFCFRFAELGAAKVTGMEIVGRQVEAARWCRDMLGYENVDFRHVDFLADMTVPKHDVVFCSEVVNHFPFPLYGLARLVSVARETFVFDTGAVNKPEQWIRMDTTWNLTKEQMICHSFYLSDGMILDFLNLIGVTPDRVKRYKAPANEYHILYIVDTRGLAEERARRSARQSAPYLQDILKSIEPKE